MKIQSKYTLAAAAVEFSCKTVQPSSRLSGCRKREIRPRWRAAKYFAQSVCPTDWYLHEKENGGYCSLPSLVLVSWSPCLDTVNVCVLDFPIWGELTLSSCSSAETNFAGEFEFAICSCRRQFTSWLCATPCICTENTLYLHGVYTVFALNIQYIHLHWICIPLYLHWISKVFALNVALNIHCICCMCTR